MSTVTVNSTAGLLAALSAAQAGDTILLSSGIYSGTNINNLSFSNAVTIASADPTNPATLTQFTVTDCSGLTFSDLNLSTASSTTPVPFRVYGGDNITFSGVTVFGDAQSGPTIGGILISGSTNATVTGSTFYDVYNAIEEINNNGVTISNNTLYNIFNDGIDNAGSSNVLISDNQLTNFSTDPGSHADAIQFWTNTTSPTSSNITITGNVMTRGSGNYYQGIFIQSGPYNNDGGSAISNINISDNIATGLLYRAISLQDVSDASVTDNTVTAYADLNSFITVQSSDSVALAGNSSMLYNLVGDTNLTQLDDSINSVIPVPSTTPGPPILSVPVAAAINQGSQTAISGMGLSEAGASPGEIFTVTLADTAGLLSATGAGVSGSGSAILTISGSLSQVNSDLATLADTDASSATDTINVSASDSLGNTAAPAAIAVAVSPAVAPAIIAPATVTVGADQNTTVPGVSLSDTGSAADGTFTVTLTDTTGDLLETAGQGAVTGNGTPDMTIVGSLAQVNADLATLTDPASLSSTTGAIDVTATNSFGLVAKPAAITVIVNGAPAIAGPASVMISQNSATSVSGVNLSEAGNTTGETFAVTLTDTNGLLSATGAGVSGSGGATLTVSGSLTQVNSDLATLADTDASTAADTISITASDSFGNAASAVSIAVGVNPATLTPAITAPATATVGQKSRTAISGVSLSEAGNTTGESFTVTLTDTNGLLSATGAGVSGSGSAALTISGSLSQVNSDLATLADTDASSAADTISITASDSLGDTAAPAAIAVTVNPAALTPAITAPASATVNQELQTAISGVSLSEAGSSTGETFTVTLTDTNGLFSATGAGVSGSGSAALTISGSLTQVNSDLATLADTDASTAADTISITASDSFGNAASAVSIAVGVNPAILTPAVTAPASATVGQKSQTAISGVGLSEADSSTGETFTVTLTDTNGLLSATGAGVSGSGTTKLTISGSLTQVNSDLATLADTDASTAADTISITASDSFGNAASAVSIAVGVNPATLTPAITAPATATVGQKSRTAINGVSLSEAGNSTGETFTVTLRDTNGLLSAKGAGVSGSGTTKLTISGSLSQANSDLATLADTDASSASDTINIAASDSLGDTAAPAAITVKVNAATTTKPIHGNGGGKHKSLTNFVSSMSTLSPVSGASAAASGQTPVPTEPSLSMPRFSYA